MPPLSSTGDAKKWLHREQQLQQLQLLLNLPQPPDVLVYGPSCTGKTAIVRSVSEQMQLVEGMGHAYILHRPQLQLWKASTACSFCLQACS